MLVRFSFTFKGFIQENESHLVSLAWKLCGSKHNTNVMERSPTRADNSASFSHTILSFYETSMFIALLTTARYQAVT